FANASPERMADFFDYCMEDLKLDNLTISPGYAYERAPDQQHFLNRQKTRSLFRDIFSRDKKRQWRFSQSSLFLNFLAGNETYHCTPWSNPTRNVFGWQKPCYLLGEGFVRSFKELMETTEWDSYGTGRYEKCADCMVHCGYEGTAVDDTFSRPWKALKVALFGVQTDGPMAPDIALDQARPAEYVFEKQVATAMATISDGKNGAKQRSSAA
ncbi:MAG TPA: adenosyl-hopene transferase HpnH, partial [Dongiaceae bacterium]